MDKGKGVHREVESEETRILGDEADGQQCNEFLNLTAEGCGEVPVDIAKRIADHPLELDKIRITRTKLPAEQGQGVRNMAELHELIWYEDIPDLEKMNKNRKKFHVNHGKMCYNIR